MRMKRISWTDKDCNEDVLNEDKQIWNAIWQWKHRWMGHVLRHDGLLHDVIEGRMTGKPIRGRRRLQMLCDVTEGYASLERAAEYKKGME